MNRFRYGVVPVLLAAVLAVLLAGCGGGKGAGDSASTGGASRAELERELAEAVRAANDLERRLWARPDTFTSREQVYAHYRRGFAESIAELLTTYSWSDEIQAVRPGDRSMAAPEEVRVLSVSANEAAVAYPNAAFLREAWDLPAYTVARLRREAGRWVIVDTTPSDRIPDP